MSQSLEHFLAELDDLDRSRQHIAIAALESLSASDPELAKLVYDVFRTPENAASWLSGNVPALGNEMPFRLLQKGQREIVADCLHRIQFGMFA